MTDWKLPAEIQKDLAAFVKLMHSVAAIYM